MTNYNDGKWHGWNGGDCPVHPESVVEVAWFSAGNTVQSETIVAGKRLTWKHGEAGVPPFAFRVTKEHKPLREYWVNYEEDIVFPYADTDNKAELASEGYIRMREVE